MSTYILLSNFMKINQDIIRTYILISNFIKINTQYYSHKNKTTSTFNKSKCR
jgi:hypothetical protein